MESVAKSPRSRPYFLPETFDLEAQPAAFQAAFDAIIEPAYQQLVVAPLDALERAAGTTIVFMLVEELIDQLELGLQFDLASGATCGDRGAREKAINRHLRTVSAKQTAINALLRLRKLSLQPRVISMGPPAF